MFKSKLLWIAIAFFGVLPPVIILFLYDYSVTGEVFSLLSKGVSASLSKDSSHWSDFGSLLSGVFTLLGAIASLATLMFLLQQQKNSDIERKEQLSLQRKIQKNNDIHLESEKELMRFEMYKIHNEMYNEVLDDIELKMENGSRFMSRKLLYKNIFPENTFSSFSTKPDLGASHGLKEITNHYEKCLKSAINIVDENSAYDFIMNFQLLNFSMFIQGDSKIEYLNFSHHDKNMGINALNIEDCMRVYGNAISDLYDFSEVKAPEFPSLDKTNINPTINLLRCVINLNLSKIYNLSAQHYGVEMTPLDSECLDFILMIYDKSLGTHDAPLLPQTLGEIIRWIIESKNLPEKYFTPHRKLRALIPVLTSEISDRYGDGDDSKEYRELNMLRMQAFGKSMRNRD